MQSNNKRQIKEKIKSLQKYLEAKGNNIKKKRLELEAKINSLQSEILELKRTLLNVLKEIEAYEVLPGVCKYLRGD